MNLKFSLQRYDNFATYASEKEKNYGKMRTRLRMSFFLCNFARKIEKHMWESFLQTEWLVVITKILLATGLGYILGAERELHGKVVGTRTISLIAIGSALYVLMSPSIVGGDNSRIIAQVVSGIGFLGAGIIFKNGDTVKGLTTAATVWCAAAVGCLCGAGMFAEAILGTIVIMIVNICFKHLKEHKDDHPDQKEEK